MSAPPPITGYRQLSEGDVEVINDLKADEAALLAAIRKLGELGDYDPRWMAIGVTHIQQGFMALVRAIARPA